MAEITCSGQAGPAGLLAGLCGIARHDPIGAAVLTRNPLPDMDTAGEPAEVLAVPHLDERQPDGIGTGSRRPAAAGRPHQKIPSVRM